VTGAAWGPEAGSECGGGDGGGGGGDGGGGVLTRVHEVEVDEDADRNLAGNHLGSALDEQELAAQPDIGFVGRGGW
jgi:hypothetical protein